MTQLAMTKANRASLLRLALCLSRCEVNVAATRSTATLRQRAKASDRGLPCSLRASLNVIPLGAEVVGGAIDRFQEHQQIRLLRRGQRRLQSWSSAETPAHRAPTRAAGRRPPGSGLGRGAGTARDS